MPILTDQHGMLTIFESVNTENIITVPRLHQKLVKCICLKLFLILLKMIGNVMGIDGSNVGTKSFPKKDPLWIKYYFNVYDRKSQNGFNSFTKRVYQLLVDKKLKFLHYIGDKNSTIPFKRNISFEENKRQCCIWF